jgi:rod shape-determining protein MreB
VCAYANLEMDKKSHIMVVDIGKQLTDITVLNGYDVDFGRTYFIGGETMDASITTFIQDNHNLEVSDLTSEAIKNEVASLYERDLYSTEYIGIDENNKFVKHLITANEVRVAIQNVYDKILGFITEVINLQSKEIGAQIYANGVMFIGGGSKISGLYEYAKKKLDMPIIIQDEPMDSVILGAGKLLNTKDYAKIEL